MKRNYEYTINPVILQHPNIPKPLHGVNPRTIFGEEWWNKTRKDAYASNNYHCFACGVHKSQAKKYKWLEAHEFWDINEHTGICEVKEIVPLCHYCHKFIHSGKLQMDLLKGKKSIDECIEILEHGFKILSDNKLKAFPGTLLFANKISANTYGVKYYKIKDDLAWEDYVMLYNGKYYGSKFKSCKEWEEHYKTI